MVSKVNVDELTMFLRPRGLRISGTKAELVVGIFVAFKTNIRRSTHAFQAKP